MIAAPVAKQFIAFLKTNPTGCGARAPEPDKMAFHVNIGVAAPGRFGDDRRRRENPTSIVCDT